MGFRMQAPPGLERGHRVVRAAPFGRLGKNRAGAGAFPYLDDRIRHKIGRTRCAGC